MTTLNTSLISVPKIYRNKRIYQRGGVFVSTIGGESTGDAYIAGNGITIDAGEISLDTNFIEVTPDEGVQLKYNNITELEVISGGVTVPRQLGVGGTPIGNYAGYFLSESAASVWLNTCALYDNRAMAQGVGGGITFGGKYTTVGGLTTAGFFRVEKENAEDAEYGFDMLIGNRIHGLVPATVIKLAALDGRAQFQHSLDSLDTTFSSGFTGAGWKLLKTGSGGTAKYSFEVDNLRVRGSMNVYELILNKIRATNGSLWVTDACELSDVVFVSGDSYRCYVDDPTLNPQTFAVNDIIKCQRYTGPNVKEYQGIVTSIDAGGAYYVVDLHASAPDIPEIGDTVVRIGNTTTDARKGSIFLTSSEPDSPYIDMLDAYTVPYTAFADKSVLRLGNLDGLTDADFSTLGGYGLYSQNAFLKGGIYATFGEIGGWNIDTDAICSDLGTKHTADNYAAGGLTLAADGGIHSKNFYVDADGEVGIRTKLIRSYILSNTPIFTASAIPSTSEIEPYLVKTITLGSDIRQGLTMRIWFDIHVSDAAGMAYGRIYRYRGTTETAVGTVRNSANGIDWKTWEEDITDWYPDDLIRLKLWVSSGIYTAYAQNFKVTGDHAIEVNEVTAS